MKFFEMPIGANHAKMSAYLHDPSSELSNAEKRPALLIFPGGGYTMCSDREAEPIALSYMAEGYNAFVLRYTAGRGISHVSEKALDDAENAMAAILENADEWGVVKEKIAVVGFSAGGHLAASLGTIGKNKPSALILGYPCILKSMMQVLKSDAPGLEDKVSAETPPAFIFHTSYDKIVPVNNSLLFANSLAEKGIKFDLHVFQDGPHGLSLAKAHTADGVSAQVNASAAKWFDMSVDWLKNIWGDFLVGELYEKELSKQELAVTKTMIRILKNDTKLWDIVIEEIPQLAKMSSMHEAVDSLTIEKIAGFSPDAISEASILRLQERVNLITKEL